MPTDVSRSVRALSQINMRQWALTRSSKRPTALGSISDHEPPCREKAARSARRVSYDRGMGRAGNFCPIPGWGLRGS